MNNIDFCVRLDYYDGNIYIAHFDNRDERDAYMYMQLVNPTVKHIGWFEDDKHTQTQTTWLS